MPEHRSKPDTDRISIPPTIPLCRKCGHVSKNKASLGDHYLHNPSHRLPPGQISPEARAKLQAILAANPELAKRIDEAQKYRELPAKDNRDMTLVRIEPGGLHKHWAAARLIRVEGTQALVKPFKHGGRTKMVPLEQVRPWVAGNLKLRAQETGREYVVQEKAGEKLVALNVATMQFWNGGYHPWVQEPNRARVYEDRASGNRAVGKLRLTATCPADIQLKTFEEALALYHIKYPPSDIPTLPIPSAPPAPSIPPIPPVESPQAVPIADTSSQPIYVPIEGLAQLDIKAFLALFKDLAPDRMQAIAANLLDLAQRLMKIADAKAMLYEAQAEYDRAQNEITKPGDK